jgi:hypothetical protein
MSRARHKMRADGGRLASEEGSDKPKWNAGEDQNAAKEADERKKGGRVKAEGEAAKKRMDHKERARGGHVNEKMHEGVGSYNKGGVARGRARGGRIGADRAPLTTAAKVKHVTKGEEPEEGRPDQADKRMT